MFQGVLAVGKIPVTHALETVLQQSAPPRLWAAVEGLSNAENVGVLVRNCAAFGVQALLVGRTSSSPFLRRAVRSSMGAVFRLPIMENVDLPDTLRALRARGIRCLAAHPHADDRKLQHAGLSADCCVVFGSEGEGISPEVLEACDQMVAIPMASGVDSLNVGNAAAVFFYEALRQRDRV
jgi:tRNA G18 (ribose-2'-O)-methylase SpoU